jgi:hypothetical protein
MSIIYLIKYLFFNKELPPIYKKNRIIYRSKSITMTTLSTNLAVLKTLIGQCETELLALQSGRKASAPRVRASLQKIKALAHSMRAGVMDFTKELPTKTRVKKDVTPIDDDLPPPPMLERTESEAPVKKTRVSRKKPVKDVVV